MATRWHDASLSRFQLGFVLALASTKLLAEEGYMLWDRELTPTTRTLPAVHSGSARNCSTSLLPLTLLAVGGTDSSPGMRYKASVTEHTLRPAYSLLHAEAQAAGAPKAERLRPGSVPLRSISERELLL